MVGTPLQQHLGLKISEIYGLFIRNPLLYKP